MTRKCREFCNNVVDRNFVKIFRISKFERIFHKFLSSTLFISIVILFFLFALLFHLFYCIFIIIHALIVVHRNNEFSLTQNTSKNNIFIKFKTSIDKQQTNIVTKKKRFDFDDDNNDKYKTNFVFESFENDEFRNFI